MAEIRDEGTETDIDSHPAMKDLVDSQVEFRERIDEIVRRIVER